MKMTINLDEKEIKEILTNHFIKLSYLVNSITLHCHEGDRNGGDWVSASLEVKDKTLKDA